jgi:hypothetical protein
LFSGTDEYIQQYLSCASKYFFIKDLGYAFILPNGKQMTISYLNQRLKHYNKYIPEACRIEHLYVFRQYYIYDILNIKGITQSFISKQIGNSTSENLLYSNL